MIYQRICIYLRKYRDVSSFPVGGDEIKSKAPKMLYSFPLQSRLSAGRSGQVISGSCKINCYFTLHYARFQQIRLLSHFGINYLDCLTIVLFYMCMTYGYEHPWLFRNLPSQMFSVLQRLFIPPEVILGEKISPFLMICLRSAGKKTHISF